jgi:hypothetical protein
MSITMIAHQAQGMCAGQVIAKLAEDAYFMRVNTRVTQPPPVRNHDNEATSRSADLGRCDNPPRKIPYYRLRPIHFGH